MAKLTANLLGQAWSIAFTRLRGKANGYCYGPKHKRILVHNRLPPQEELEVTIHELLHATDWWKDEEWVKHVACDVADILWRLGYRRDKEQSEV